MISKVVSMALVVVLGVAFGNAAKATTGDGSPGVVLEDARGRDLLNVALGIDGVMSCDLALRLLETGQLHTPELRREACELALARMSAASDPFPLDLVADLQSGTREDETHMGLELFAVDRLSMRCRLVVQYLEVDPQLARELLLELPPGLGIPKSGCTDGLLPTAGVFYRTLRVVLAETLTAEERRNGLHWEIARRYVGGITTVGEIAPACAFIDSLDAPTAVVELLGAELAGAIARLEASPRWIFQRALRTNWQPVSTIFERLARSETVSKRLREELRQLVLRSLAAPRCADLPAAAFPTDDVAYFNDTFFSARPLQRDEATDPSRGEAPKRTSLWTSKTSARYLFEFQNLNWERKLMEERKETNWTEWTIGYRKYAARLRDWTSIDERDDYDFIVQKGSLTSALLENAPDEASQLEAIKDFVVMMRHANRAEIPPYVLVHHAAVTLSRLRESRRRTALEMFKSGPGVVSAYAALQLEGVDVFRIAP